MQYAWAAPGVYPVTLTVTDDSATGSAVATTTHRRHGQRRAGRRRRARPVGRGQRGRLRRRRLAATPTARITSYEWSFGDGATASGRSVRHAYARPGTYEVALVVRDDSGAPLNAARDTAIVRVNAAPIADAGPDLVAAPGEEVVLDGSGSVDPDGAVADWLWRFPDGSEAQGQRVARTFASPGPAAGAADRPRRHRARRGLRRRRGRGRGQRPAGRRRRPRPRWSRRARRSGFDGSASFDPGRHHRLLALGLRRPRRAGARGDRRADASTRPGVHSAQLTVTDASGAANATASDEVAIRVNHPPVAEAGPETVTDALYVTLDGSGSSDADGDRLIHTWDFGDGSPPALGETVTHAYPRSGIFPVTLTVDDGTGLGNATAVDSTRVLIDARPLAVAGGNRDVCSGDAILFDGSASSDPDGGLLRYDWDFGDGTRAGHRQPEQDLRVAGRLHRHPDRARRIRPAASACTATASPRWCARRRSPHAGPPVMACTNQTVRLDGSGSTDADGAVNAFSWNFGDGIERRRRAADPRLRAAGHLHGHPDHHRRRPRLLRRARHRRDDGDGRRGAAASRSSAPTASPPAPASPSTPRWSATLDVRGAEFAWDFGDGATADRPDGRARLRRARRPHRHAARGAARRQRGLRHRSRRAGIVAVNAPPAPVIEVARPDRGRRAGALRRRGLDAIPTARSPASPGTSATARPRPAFRPSTASPRPAPTRCGSPRPTTPASATAASRRPAPSRSARRRSPACGRRRSSARACRTPGPSPRTPPI